MLKFTIAFCLLFSTIQIYSQTKKFNNSVIRGKALICAGYVERYPCYDSTCRKIGKWFYYNKDGSIQRIENYKKISDCNINEIPDGFWKYYDKQGSLIKQDEYKNGVLWSSDLGKFYVNDQLAGIIQIRNGILDTLKYIDFDDANYIENGDFNLYFGKPALLVNDGQSELGEQIPYWNSPIKNTPDYYNQYRRFKNVPDNQFHAFNDQYHYVGIILYHQPTEYYSEYITGIISPNLEPQKKYCLKIRIRLSQNSGFCVDKLGVFFSERIPPNYDTVPQILFSYKLDNRDKWQTLCANYSAAGNEKYISLGRFLSLNSVNINPITPVNVSEGEYNQSAYYLIDQLELVEDTNECNCLITDTKNALNNRVNFDLINPADSSIYTKTFVLSNIYFEFDQSELLPASYKELEKLLEFLKGNKLSIFISGHTDNIGSYEYNKKLSLARARAVAEWLIERGIEKSQIDIEGFGSDRPIIKNDTEENRSLNRRVEFEIKKIKYPIQK